MIDQILKAFVIVFLGIAGVVLSIHLGQLLFNGWVKFEAYLERRKAWKRTKEFIKKL